MNNEHTRYMCHLCGSKNTSIFYQGGKASRYRDFLHCSNCDLIFVPERYFLDQCAEKSIYLQHNNDVDDPGYRSFLNRLYSELKPQLKPQSKGLDYGAGPGPALAAMMQEDGFDVSVYDPLFFRKIEALKETYDFITCSETAEHFRSPSVEFDRINDMLRPCSWFGVMTSMLESWSDFSEWYYHRDPTHVCFYSRNTMIWIAGRYGWKALFPRQNVVLFHKTPVSTILSQPP